MKNLLKTIIITLFMVCGFSILNAETITYDTTIIVELESDIGEYQGGADGFSVVLTEGEIEQLKIDKERAEMEEQLEQAKEIALNSIKILQDIKQSKATITIHISKTITYEEEPNLPYVSDYSEGYNKQVIGMVQITFITFIALLIVNKYHILKIFDKEDKEDDE